MVNHVLLITTCHQHLPQHSPDAPVAPVRVEGEGQLGVIGLLSPPLLAEIALELVKGLLAALIPYQLGSMLFAEAGIKRLSLGGVLGVVP